MRIPFFLFRFLFVLLHLGILLLHLPILCLPILYPLLTYLLIPCRNLIQLLVVVVNSAIHLHFPSRVMCGGMLLIWMHRDLETCLQAIVLWPSVIDKKCCAILTFRHGSNVGHTVVDVVCPCLVVSAVQLIVPSLAAMKRSSVRIICRRLCSVLMGSRYPKIVLPLSS